MLEFMTNIGSLVSNWVSKTVTDGAKDFLKVLKKWNFILTKICPPLQRLQYCSLVINKQ